MPIWLARPALFQPAAKAERIVDWRKKNGGFKRTLDLRRVKGFGYKSFKKLEPYLDIKGDTTLAESPARDAFLKSDCKPGGL